jgi:hypothetical protein
MAKRNISSDHTLRVGLQAVICGVGLLGGLILGAAIVYLGGFWQEFGEVWKTPLDSMTTVDLIVVAATLVIVFGCGWLGARWGIARAARIET